jgi:plasmid stabilization system protein ParE
MAKGSKARVFLPDRAIADLQEIASYTIGKGGEAQAAKYLDAFDPFFNLIDDE